jgi:hypothetical protein
LKEYAAREQKRIKFVFIPPVDVKASLSEPKADKRGSGTQGRIVVDEKNAPPKNKTLLNTTWKRVYGNDQDYVSGVSERWEFQEGRVLKVITSNDLDGERSWNYQWDQDGNKLTVTPTQSDSDWKFSATINDDTIIGQETWTGNGVARTRERKYQRAD